MSERKRIACVAIFCPLVFRFRSNIPHKHLYLVEGEKDADNLNQLFRDNSIAGYVATTSGSAQNSECWAGCIAKYELAKKRIIVLPDCDETGLSFGRRVCQTFHEAQADVVFVVLFPNTNDKPNKDISDWIELQQQAGKSSEDILRKFNGLCENAENVTDEVIQSWKTDKDETEKSYSGKQRAKVTLINDITETETKWLWENKIPRGELTLVSGLAGQGKSFWTCYLASVVTNGWNWTDGSPCPQGSVLFFQGEDSMSTYRQRLRANVADLLKVTILESSFVEGKEGDEIPMTLERISVIEDAIQQTEQQTGLPVRLIVIDPIADYWGNVRENSNSEVRKVLKPLKQLAEKHEVAFLLIQHIGKSADRETMQQRVLGSTGIVAACRSAWNIFFDKKTKHRTFAPMKTNLCIEPKSVVFVIDSTVDGGQVQIIDAALNKSADEIYDELRNENRGRNPKEIFEVEDWLREFLSDGRKPVKEIKNAADSKKFSWRTIRRASDNLGIAKTQEMKVYFWELPSFPELTHQVAQNNSGQPEF
ncbi:MAG: AAA family ATPase [Planctomycetaceae bacterium]|jgi:5S rRNA maturation endonuclease (ribonuclease M5)|nr:AAA family ATPase [Planctomycetaceae bacterium]